MKKFLVQNTLFIFFVVSVLFLFSSFSLKYPSFLKTIGYSKDWFELHSIITASSKDISSDTLYIGDSVGAQLFPPTQSENYITTNAGVLMTGQYIIAAKTIASNPNLKCIVLVGLPKSIGAKFEGHLTFNGFVKPFYNQSNIKYFDEALLKKVKQKRYAHYFKYSLVKFLPISDIDYYDNDAQYNIMETFRFSPLSIQYIKKLIALCKAKEIALHFVSGPMNKSHIEKTNNWKVLRNQLKSENLEDAFRPYFKSINYIGSNNFTDGYHLKPNVISKMKTHLQQQLAIGQK